MKDWYETLEPRPANKSGVGKVWVIEFDSYLQMVDYATTAPANSRYSQRARNKKYDWGDAVARAERGWPEATAKMKAFAEAVTEKAMSQVALPVAHYIDHPGMTFDIGRVLEGEPEHWLTMDDEYRDAPGGVVRIVVNCSASSGITDEQLFNRGAAAVALAMCFERAGRPTIVEVVDSVERIELHCPVKRADEPINLVTLAYALCHHDTLGAFMFAADEACPGRPDVYGYPTDVRRPEAMGDIYFARMYYRHAQWESAEATTAWVIDQLRKQGVNIVE